MGLIHNANSKTTVAIHHSAKQNCFQLKLASTDPGKMQNGPSTTMVLLSGNIIGV